MLRRLGGSGGGGLAESIDYEGLKRGVLPAMHALCLRTTSGAAPP